MTRPQFLTPDDLPSAYTAWQFTLPVESPYLGLMLGAMRELTQAGNWELKGSVTEDEIIAIYEAVIASVRLSVNVGVVVWFAGLYPGTNWLACDGAEYDSADYPVLAEALGDLYGGSYPNTFRVPDIRSRFIWGYEEEGTPPTGIGSTGGEVTHTLTSNEMPSHHHSEHNHGLPALTLEGAIPVSTPNVVPGTTGDTGGGESHNNMPPYIALRPFIIAF